MKAVLIGFCLSLASVSALAGTPVRLAQPSPEGTAQSRDERVDFIMRQLAGMPALSSNSSPAPVPKSKLLLPPGYFDQPNGRAEAEVSKVDEPGGTASLQTNRSLACPGFFVLGVGDGPVAGFSRGSYGSEVLLEAPGSRLLQGGLNFGGLLDRSAPGFAAFTIANSSSESQRIDIAVSGFRTAPGTPSATLRITLDRRAPTAQSIVNTVQTVTSSTTYSTSVTVQPGFYVAAVELVSGGDAGGSADAFFAMSILTSFVNRAGGGFQGGAVVGGYHDPGSLPVSGFAGFCLDDPHTVRVRTEGAPTRGAGGARDLQVLIANADGQIVAGFPSSSTPPPPPPPPPPAGDDHGNDCPFATSVSLGSTVSGMIGTVGDVDFFRFSVPNTQTLTIRSSGSTDVFAVLGDANCVTIAIDDDSGGGVQFLFTRTFAPGTYFLAVAGFAGTTTGAYSVSFGGSSVPPPPSTVSTVFEFDNRLVQPVNVFVNGVGVGSARAQEINSYTYNGPASVDVRFELIRPQAGGTGPSIGDQINGVFDRITAQSGRTERFNISNVVGSSFYFAPIITNQTSARLLMGANMDLQSENRCNCVVPGFGNRVGIGYYRLFTNSNVRAYRESSGYTGTYIYWGADTSGTTVQLPTIAAAGSGAVELTANRAP